MKKILFIMPALPGGGAEKVLVDILKHFDYTCYDVTLFLEYREGTYLQDVPEHVHILSLHGSNNLWFQRLHRRLTERGLYARFNEIVYRTEFLWLMRGRHYDTIISFMEGAAVKYHSYITDKGLRNVSWVHIDFKIKHWSLDFFRNEDDEMRCYQKMDHIVFVSKDAMKRFLEIYPVNSDMCRILYNLIDEQDIRRKANLKHVDKRKFTICMVGRLNRQKRYDRAIEVAYKLKNAGYDFELRILGEGELLAEIKEKVLLYDLVDTVLLMGFVKSPYAYMAQSDIFLNTSESEGYPLTICEALCLGVPVVATHITGASEILSDSRFGLLADEDVDAIFNAVKTLMDNTPLRKSYACKSLERAMMFRADETMRQIYSII